MACGRHHLPPGIRLMHLSVTSAGVQAGQGIKNQPDRSAAHIFGTPHSSSSFGTPHSSSSHRHDAARRTPSRRAGGRLRADYHHHQLQCRGATQRGSQHGDRSSQRCQVYARFMAEPCKHGEACDRAASSNGGTAKAEAAAVSSGLSGCITTGEWACAHDVRP